MGVESTGSIIISPLTLVSLPASSADSLPPRLRQGAGRGGASSAPWPSQRQRQMQSNTGVHSFAGQVHGVQLCTMACGLQRSCCRAQPQLPKCAASGCRERALRHGWSCSQCMIDQTSLSGFLSCAGCPPVACQHHASGVQQWPELGVSECCVNHPPAASGSRIKDQGPRIKDQGSRIKDQGSRIKDQASGSRRMC
jgi:hypothetical protein